ncbi:MAG TPA: polysaccharide deacetylase family protein [Roseiflexaceae bacterium]
MEWSLLDDVTVGRAYLSVWASRLLRRRFPGALWAGQPVAPQVALTFDDGPDPRDTPQLLDVLAQQQVTATFFELGQRAERWPALVRAVAVAGHQLALHGYRHRPFPLEARLALRGQLAYTQRLLAALGGQESSAIRDVRPPYGLCTPAGLIALAAWGYRPVMWSVVPFHWQQSANATIVQTTRLVRAGSVLVLHESLGGPAVADLADVIVTRLKAAGFQFVSVDQMWRVHSSAT